MDQFTKLFEFELDNVDDDIAERFRALPTGSCEVGLATRLQTARYLKKIHEVIDDKIKREPLRLFQEQ